jgi:hypothetical protein
VIVTTTMVAVLAAASRYLAAVRQHQSGKRKWRKRKGNQ